MAGASKIAIGARSSVADLEPEIKKAAAEAGRPEPQVLALELDVSSEDSVRKAAEVIGTSFGDSLDVLINNAGYLETWLPVAESNPLDWWRSWEVNIKGTYLCCRYMLPLLLKSEGKTLINVTSAGAHNMSPGASAYQTSRFATCRFTEFVHHEYSDQGLVAIAIHPGGIKTELALNMPKAMHAILIDEVELPADMMVWLSKEPREWLSGRFVSCCWDVNELEGRKKEIVENDLLKFRMKV
ncbi:putative short chain dehydrogenase reductase protein [Phaeoacremonium minimum UCRPA7]|uniref:Putative short chain dehydrogenase reductase protein n=1 Tax=Phaeoacremonium minimum (strain UCR-PA7) TaxID=1286976 RepID=R8BWS2_PHAM7|nr:putative short chain dehydrogenase reductase protein [Phaeoacremonium minimum UCRPA7]EOO03803.1 putative short chain dehydrogenase reductase protein [Phaeoacremonium minimum UCRPA7]